MPLEPGKPTILTFYIARTELFSMSYRDIERRVRGQSAAMFGDYGFNPKRHIAGISSNHWGHACVVSRPDSISA